MPDILGLHETVQWVHCTYIQIHSILYCIVPLCLISILILPSFPPNPFQAQLEAIGAVYNPLRAAMTVSYFPGIPELLAVRDNMILRIEKTSGARARQFTSCELNKVLIGKVR